MNRFAFALPLFVLATPALAQPAEPYHASGTEPFWSLSIDAAQMRFQPASGPAVTVPTPRVINGFAGEIYRAPGLDVNIVHQPCTNGMSDRRYHDQVSVTIGRQTLRGCGGEILFNAPPRPNPYLPGGSLAGTNWTIAALDGRPVRLDRPTDLRFGNDRIDGHAGCNAFGARYALDRGFLRIGPVLSTKMACLGGGMTVENRVFRLLAQPLKLNWQGRDRIELVGPSGRMVIERVR